MILKQMVFGLATVKCKEIRKSMICGALVRHGEEKNKLSIL
jgi:hypothetical protein